MDVEILSRIQFAFTVAFHYIYPPLSIGIGLIIVIMEGLYLRTRNKLYEDMTRFWIKIFALTFGIGVATGIVMEFEFGTNWATYSRYVGDVFGSALAALGIRLYGYRTTIGQSVWVVYGRNGPPTMGGIRFTAHLGCALEGRNSQSGSFFTY
jgi:cytochrome bd ubiquinol oxidase subunit I